MSTKRSENRLKINEVIAIIKSDKFFGPQYIKDAKMLPK